MTDADDKPRFAETRDLVGPYRLGSDGGQQVRQHLPGLDQCDEIASHFNVPSHIIDKRIRQLVSLGKFH